MIALVTGAPGNGKSYYTCRLIAAAVLSGRFVATNIRLVDDWPERILKGHLANLSPGRRRRVIARWRSRVVQVENVGELARIRLGTAGWEKKLEGRGVFVFDEATEVLGARTWNDEGRRQAMRFFEQHRKLGWDGYVIAQDAERIDKQLRTLVEYEIVLRNLKRYKPFLGLPLWPFGNLFLALWRWHGERGNRPMKKELFPLSKRIAGLYDTHQVVHQVEDDDGLPLLWLPRPTAQAAPRPEAVGAPALSGPADHTRVDAAPPYAPGRADLTTIQPALARARQTGSVRAVEGPEPSTHAPRLLKCSPSGDVRSDLDAPGMPSDPQNVNDPAGRRGRSLHRRVPARDAHDGG